MGHNQAMATMARTQARIDQSWANSDAMLARNNAAIGAAQAYSNALNPMYSGMYQPMTNMMFSPAFSTGW